MSFFFGEKMEQSGKWPQQACTTMFFLIPKNISSERPTALIPTFDSLVGSLESARSGKVAADVSRGLERHGWSKRRSSAHSAEDQGAVALVLDLAKAFERVSLPVVWKTHFSFTRKILRVLCNYFEHQSRVQFEGCAAEPLTTITAILPGSKWSCLLLHISLQDALSEVTKIYPSLKLRVFVDDITALEEKIKKCRKWQRR